MNKTSRKPEHGGKKQLQKGHDVAIKNQEQNTKR